MNRLFFIYIFALIFICSCEPSPSNEIVLDELLKIQYNKVHNRLQLLERNDTSIHGYQSKLVHVNEHFSEIKIHNSEGVDVCSELEDLLTEIDGYWIDWSNNEYHETRFEYIIQSCPRLSSLDRKHLMDLIELEVYNSLISNIYADRFQFEVINANVIQECSYDSDGNYKIKIGIVAGTSSEFVVDFQESNSNIQHRTDEGNFQVFDIPKNALNDSLIKGEIRRKMINLGSIYEVSLPFEFTIEK